MIDLRFDPNILGDRLESDFTKLIEEYRERAGYLVKKHHHNKK